MRSRYADYPEYHTSLDDLERVVTPTGLQGGFDVVRECIEALEHEMCLYATQLGEPQLGRRGLYHQITRKSTADDVMLRTNILAYADGQHAVADMADIFGESVDTLDVMVEEAQGARPDPPVPPEQSTTTRSADLMAEVVEHYDASAPTYSEQYDESRILTSDEYPANYFRLKKIKQRVLTWGSRASTKPASATAPRWPPWPSWACDSSSTAAMVSGPSN